MLAFFTVLLVCQLIGEVIVVAAAVPVPGPVVGMAILFGGLMIHGSVPEDLAAAGELLLRHLSLLFVPAGVGVMVHADLIAGELLPIAVALVASTVLTIAVTAVLMRWLGRRRDSDDR
ncbi:MAG: CidA/LrgA family protein [Rhodospirillales bacterium]